MPIINVETMEEYSQYLKNNRYVVANFSASFCKPCKDIYPFIEELALNNQHITFLKIDIENGYKISDYYDITSIPYFKFYKNEVEITSYCGTDKKIIQESIDNMSCMYL
jgi:thiol-disulfide isomerase/thioredoxin